MPKIQQLPDSLVARIAAGEVVERPASVLKELVENALDAGATEVDIVIEGAGRTRLQVADNGCGLSKEDARLALLRHATSKISDYDDLESLSTYGFRGEALPSIAAVSRFRLTTRASEEDSGWELLWEGGKLISEKPIARPVGTTVEVRDLFFNTPARFKFMKTDSTERAQCLHVVEEVVFHSLGVTFHARLEDAKPMVFKSHVLLTREKKLQAIKERAAEAWGVRWKSGAVSVFDEDKHFSVWGTVSHPDAHAATPKNQLLFVNGRPVHNRRLTRAVYDAYTGQLFVGRHPSWILFLEVNPKTVDVNVHPSKREVKLAFENEIFGFLVSVVRRSLRESAGSLMETPPPFSHVLAAAPQAPSVGAPPGEHAGSSAPGGGLPLNFSASSAYEAREKPAVAFFTETLRAVAQVNGMFILAESEEGLVIVDQHAAAEKVLYEKLMTNRQTKKPNIQMLLVPTTWEVALSVAPLLTSKLESLNEFGFLIEPFGGETFLVKGAPAELGDKFDLLTLLDGLSDALGESTDAKGGQERNFDHRLATAAACKGSVRAGDRLDLKECQRILDDLAGLDAPHTCPHGRPTVVRMPFTELERRFRRI